MKEFLNLLWRPIILDRDTFEAQRNSPDAFKRAFLVVVVVGLFVGLFAGALQVGQTVLTPPLTQETMAQQIGPFLSNIPPEIRAMIEDGFRIGISVDKVMRADPTKFLIDHVLRALALWLTSPIGLLAAIIPFTLLVLLIARLLGGRATLVGMLGCTLLAVTPHLFDPLGIVLGAIPCCGGCLGGLVGIITFVWSVVIFCVGVTVANGFSYVKGVAAVVIGVLVPIVGSAVVLALFAIIMFLLTSMGGKS